MMYGIRNDINLIIHAARSFNGADKFCTVLFHRGGRVFCVNVLAFFLFVSKWSLYMYGMGKYHAINFNMEQTTLWS